MAEEEYEGNVQDMPVMEKEYPSLAATEEAQDLSTLPKIVVPPPAYTDPNDPAAAQGSVNLALDSAPTEIAGDYAADVEPGVDDGPSSPMDTHAEPGGTSGTSAEDKTDWKAADWKNAIDAANSQAELDALAAEYDESGAEFTTVEAAFESRAADFNEGS